jgi:hypothetical protein
MSAYETAMKNDWWALLSAPWKKFSGKIGRISQHLHWNGFKMTS